ncbi:MAG: IS701 family transposase [Cyclobacteriaceae bacterium]|nr:IS701 family transposase [Cyclobacteriaceae bacterium]
MEFSEVFRSQTHSSLDQASGYVQGLFKSPKGRANCYFMGNSLNEFDGQNLHHMLTTSPWEYSKLFRAILKRSIKWLRTHGERIYILIDEVGYRKKGKHSACVGHQYLGCIGKNDNGQVAVTAALSGGDFYCPVEMELFMPKDWGDDAELREKAGIPATKKQESKTVIALRMIKKLYKKISKDVECVVFDALYGNTVGLLRQLMILEIPFVGDIKENLTVYMREPSWKIPPYSGRGRKFTKERPDKEPIMVRDYMHGLTIEDFKLLTVRNGTKGILQARYHMRKVWVLHDPSKTFLTLHLLIRKDADGKTKYSLGFFNQKVTMKRMAKAQAQRVFVERVFEEGKNIAGMGDYQTRSWTGFHRHAALSSLALLFLMEQKITLKKTIGRITAYQIQELVNATVNTLCSIEQVIEKLLDQIPRYQKLIQNQLKTVT